MKPRSRILGGSVAVLVAAGVMIAITIEQPSHSYACKNNLLQIGIGLSNYQSAWGMFPSGTISNPELPPEKRLSWLVSILYFMEGGGPLIIDYSKAWDEGENRLIMRGQKEVHGVYPYEDLRFYQCPASHHSVDSAGQGLSDYVAVAGLGADVPGLPSGDRRAGVFGYERTTKLDEITDGLATTMAVIETTNGIGPWKAGGPGTIRGLDPSRQPYIAKNGQFGGNHRGGCMVLFVDGSVRFVSATIDPNVFEAFSTIAGGETISSKWEQ